MLLFFQNLAYTDGNERDPPREGFRSGLTSLDVRRGSFVLWLYHGVFQMMRALGCAIHPSNVMPRVWLAVVML